MNKLPLLIETSQIEKTKKVSQYAIQKRQN